ncbi:hypothetical protein DFA_10686 [Cavenderia fasciculata]|uniref:Uncharacterized protein n=1 Tax=Cavenderia fasciculata TaxID=261658 RepID=F4QB41_CACFS|nr:uncharacterized protein DFA_10686 [Cavenderia fasciculata]EGG14813.1 hypothetical protein DFA_10686 [Cavenderia fasciculata]|eukprot:XP_004351329.1 hypothetical protein DFA_10686 [Cavenderia fasciculata]
MLKLLLYKTGARQKERAVGIIQKIGAKMGMRSNKDVYPYFHHLIDPIVWHLVNVNMMFLILKVVVVNEGINQNSQLLFDRFMQSLMDPPPSKMKTHPWYLRIRASNQIQVFNKCDNEYCQKLEIISEKEYTDELSENRYKDFESTLVNWIKVHSILCSIYYTRHKEGTTTTTTTTTMSNALGNDTPNDDRSG